MNCSPSLESAAHAAETAAERPPIAFLRELIAAAVRAPSGDNMQPWRFSANGDEGVIDVFLDSDRDPSPMNSGQRMSLIACGAAIENALLIATERGWCTDLELPDPGLNLIRSPWIARIHIGPRCAPAHSANSFHLIMERVVNRRIYDARPVSPVVLSDLEHSTPQLHGTSTHWIDDRGSVDELAGLIARGDEIMFGEPTMRAAFLANVRFDLPAKAQVCEGLSLASLETPPPLGAALRLMKHIPHGMFQLMGCRNIFAAHARKLVRSASGLCVITIDSPEQRKELHVGRALQRAWLALTGLGFAAQPMMSLLVLDNALRHGTPELVARLKQQRAKALLEELNAVLLNSGIVGRPAFLLRFGHAEPPSGRTGRRDTENRA